MNRLAILQIVEQIMTKRPISVDYNTPVFVAEKQMLKNGIGHILVRRQGKHVKILSERYVLKLLPEKFNQLKSELSGSLASSVPIFIEPSTTIREAAKVMLNNKVQLLLVSAKPQGVLTATDLAYNLPLTDGRHPKLKSAMTARVEKVDYETPLRDVILKMKEHRIGSIIITRRNKRFGIFTERDLLSIIVAPVLILLNPVGKHCSRPIITASMKLSMKEVVEAMKRNRIKRLPLSQNGRIVGILTARDIVEAYAKL